MGRYLGGHCSLSQPGLEIPFDVYKLSRLGVADPQDVPESNLPHKFYGLDLLAAGAHN